MFFNLSYEQIKAIEKLTGLKNQIKQGDMYIFLTYDHKLDILKTLTIYTDTKVIIYQNNINKAINIPFDWLKQLAEILEIK